MIKKTLTAIIAATALFGFNTNSFAAGFFDAWLKEPIFSIDEQDPGLISLNSHRRDFPAGIHCR